MQPGIRFKPRQCFFWGLLALGLTLLGDQASKEAMIGMLNLPEAPRTVTPFFNLVMVWNHGISFGMLADDGEWRRIKLIGLAALITSVMGVWLWQAQRRLTAIALGMVIGGAIGNIIDRIRYGAVADFLDFHAFGYHWPAFNLADSAICIGVAILLFESMVCGKTSSSQASSPS